ncbi:Kdo domain containing protein [Flavobacterium cheongpyeongense]|uniref:Kdo domain containing protein n=1 Tax=Flavobacterium cheongpyeongense TaxID=2212651 RepID=A0A2V4BQC4_9FLAO|nr:Kdo domain containing protein [Flavobacterium cheongpyeongense]PXY40742.1 Kdo domain containing protein [Flavobacterium cheongpyeongense]
MHEVYHPDFLSKRAEIRDAVENYETKGTLFVDGKRNKIKTFDLGEITLNVKSFKVPNFINKVVYAFFRPSKARRSYEFATILVKKEIGTPAPIAYFENFKGVLLDSYYACEQIYPDLTFRELTNDFDYPEHEIILRQFTKFTFNLHQNGIEFLDHTPGNTLIKKNPAGSYSFFLVDLNRMKFHKEMSLNQRIMNFSKLTPNRKILEVMSDEYAKLYGASYNDVLKIMITGAESFRDKFHRKKNLKKALKFWKK